MNRINYCFLESKTYFYDSTKHVWGLFSGKMLTYVGVYSNNIMYL